MKGLILRPARQRGVATVLVLSLVAGLALMVTAMVGSSRLDTQMLYAQRERMQARAFFDGGAHLLMRQYWASRQGVGAADQSPVFRQNIEFAGKRLAGSLYSLDGLIDIRAVPASTIEALLSGVGEMESAAARTLASAIVRYRDIALAGATPGNVALPLEDADDLMAVPGMRREVLDQIAFSIRASGTFSQAPNAAMLPAELAGMIAGGPQRASFAGGDTGGGSAALALAGGNVMQLTMSYDTADGRRAIGHYRVSLEESQYGIPWRIKRRFALQFAQASDRRS